MKKTIKIGVALTPQLHDSLTRRAADNAKTISAQARECIADALGKTTPVVTPPGFARLSKRRRIENAKKAVKIRWENRQKIENLENSKA